MTDATTNDLQLVTFVLFAYNQEQFVRDAVEGALSQTYKPLQIILSDDGSSDRTFMMMQEMVAEYKGPHHVVLNRNKVNLGLADHINLVAELAEGEIIIFAAGDDISTADRSDVTVKGFSTSPKVYAIYTDFHDLDTTAIRSEFVQTRSDFQMMYSGGGVGRGATYAYKRDCLVWPRRIPTTVLSEDKLLPFRATLKGDVLYMESQTVAYRKTPDSLGAQLARTRQGALHRSEHIQALTEELRLAVDGKLVGSFRARLLRFVLAYRLLVVRDISELPATIRPTARFAQRISNSIMKRVLNISARRTRLIR